MLAAPRSAAPQRGRTEPAPLRLIEVGALSPSKEYSPSLILHLPRSERQKRANNCRGISI